MGEWFLPLRVLALSLLCGEQAQGQNAHAGVPTEACLCGMKWSTNPFLMNGPQAPARNGAKRNEGLQTPGPGLHNMNYQMFALKRLIIKSHVM
jgi:hypothetical protein